MRRRRYAIGWSSSVRGRSASSLALDLAQRGIRSVLLDDADRIGEGSRGLCYSKRTLEILDRFGVGEKLVDMGVTWKLGKVYLGDELVYSFDLLPEDGHKMPAFINLQQYYLEKALVDRVLEVPEIDLRWRNRVSGIERRNDGATLTIDTPDGPYQSRCRLGDRGRRRALDLARSARPRIQGPHLRGEIPDRRCPYAGRTICRPSGVSGSIRRFIPANRR